MSAGNGKLCGLDTGGVFWARRLAAYGRRRTPGSGGAETRRLPSLAARRRRLDDAVDLRLELARRRVPRFGQLLRFPQRQHRIGERQLRDRGIDRLIEVVA